MVLMESYSPSFTPREMAVGASHGRKRLYVTPEPGGRKHPCAVEPLRAGCVSASMSGRGDPCNLSGTAGILHARLKESSLRRAFLLF